MKQTHTTNSTNHHCEILEQKHLVSKMTMCDQVSDSHEDTYECYLAVTRESRESNSCMFS